MPRAGRLAEWVLRVGRARPAAAAGSRPRGAPCHSGRACRESGPVRQPPDPARAAGARPSGRPQSRDPPDADRRPARASAPPLCPHDRQSPSVGAGAQSGAAALPRARPESVLGGRPHVSRHGRRLALSRRRAGFVLAAGDWLGAPADAPHGGDAGRPADGPRSPAPATLVHHSDRGIQYASTEYQALLAAHGMRPSMSRRGDCWDNAVVESFFSTLKQELATQQWRRAPPPNTTSTATSRASTIRCACTQRWAIKRRRLSKPPV